MAKKNDNTNGLLTVQVTPEQKARLDALLAEEKALSLTATANELRAQIMEICEKGAPLNEIAKLLSDEKLDVEALTLTLDAVEHSAPKQTRKSFTKDEVAEGFKVIGAMQGIFTVDKTMEALNTEDRSRVAQLLLKAEKEGLVTKTSAKNHTATYVVKNPASAPTPQPA